MTAKEVLNLIDWLRLQGFDNDKIVDCIETVEGKRAAAFQAAIRTASEAAVSLN